MVRTCSKCKNSLTLDNFHADKTAVMGLCYYCKECAKNNVLKHRLNPDYRKKQIEWNEKWREKNREKVRAIRVKSQHKRKLLIEDKGSYTHEEWENCKKSFNYCCALCKLPKKLTVDHIIPISKNGSNLISNIQPLCINCNSRKGSKI